MGEIQVCCYEGKWPNHVELDCDFVDTKREAIEYVARNRKKDFDKCEFNNYRIVDFLNRFPVMFFESKNIMGYKHKNN